MARKCDKCPALIHSSRKLCNQCSGVTAKAFEKAPTVTKGGMAGGEWVSGRTKAARAGVADALDILSGHNSG